MMRLCLVLLSVALASPARAEGALQLTEVLESAAVSHPRLDEAGARIIEQRGRRLAATHVFEPKADGKATAVPAGYYEYWQLAAAIEQTLPGSAIQIAGGYRLGRGDVPIYDGERQTRGGGEAFARVEVPLLADRAIDENRAEIRKAQLAVSTAEFQHLEVWLEIARDASLAYWEWVASGLKLRVAEDLLDIAQRRVEQIATQTASGALPRIAAVDARRVLLSRQSSLLEARGAFANAQQELSLYYRDADGRPVVVGMERVPSAMSVPTVRVDRVGEWIDEATENRPVLQMLEQERRQARVDLELARNARLPSLDLQAFAARDLGTGPESLGQTDVGVGLSLSVPLFQRQGRGLRRQAEAKLARVAATRRGTQDRIAASIRASARVAALATERAKLAEERLTATRTLADAERERLQQGASDVLTLNLRELDLASAADEAIEAGLDLHRASVELLYARGAAGL